MFVDLQQMFCRNIEAFRGEALSETLQNLDTKEEEAQSLEEPEIQQLITEKDRNVRNTTALFGVGGAAFLGYAFSPGGILSTLGGILGGGITFGGVGYLVSNHDREATIDLKKYRLYSSRATAKIYAIEKGLIAEPPPSEKEKLQLIFAKKFFMKISDMPRESVMQVNVKHEV